MTTQAKRQQKLLDAVMSVASDLDLPAILHRIVESAAYLVDARYGALGVLDESREGLSQFITTGISKSERADIGLLPTGHGMLGLLVAKPPSAPVPHLTQHQERFGFSSHPLSMDSFLSVPIRLRDEMFGNLYLTEKTTATSFTEDDEAAVVALAGAAAVAIENARLHAKLREATLNDDRERIARDLHDTVIQRIFATGLSLQAVVRRVEPPDVRDRVTHTIDDLDDTITQIRSTIFALEQSPGTGGVRNGLLDATREASRFLGFEPTVTFSGPLDSAIDHELTAVVLAVLRETLSNAAKHAHASAVHVDARIVDAQLALTVSDNGTGIGQHTSTGGHGLRNLNRRAEELAGRMSITRPPNGGTLITWEVPL